MKDGRRVCHLIVPTFGTPFATFGPNCHFWYTFVSFLVRRPIFGTLLSHFWYTFVSFLVHLCLTFVSFLVHLCLIFGTSTHFWYTFVSFLVRFFCLDRLGRVRENLHKINQFDAHKHGGAHLLIYYYIVKR